MVALLAVERDVGIAELLELAERELSVGALGFLQAERIGSVLGQEARDQIDAQPHRIDVPGGDRKAHGAGLMVGSRR